MDKKSWTLLKVSMEINGKSLQNYVHPPNGSFIQGGDVPTSMYGGFLSMEFISNEKYKNINFNFKGLYRTDGNYLKHSSIGALLGIANFTELNISLPVNLPK